MKKTKLQKIKQSLVGGSLLIAMCLMLTGCGSQITDENTSDSTGKADGSFNEQAGGPPDDMGAGGPPPDDGGGPGGAPTGNGAAPTN